MASSKPDSFLQKTAIGCTGGVYELCKFTQILPILPIAPISPLSPFRQNHRLHRLRDFTDFTQRMSTNYTNLHKLYRFPRFPRFPRFHRFHRQPTTDNSSQKSSIHQLIGDHLSLFQYGFGCQFLHVGGVAVLAQGTLYDHF